MTNAIAGLGRCVPLFVAAVVTLIAGFNPKASAAIEIIGVQYQPDAAFPEYNCYWSNSDYPTSCPDRPLGCNVHVYLRNTGGSSVTVSDMTLAGYSLNTVIKYDEYNGHHPYSIYFYWDNPPQAILDAGEPIWYKGDPAPIPAGGVGQAVVRLRRIPTTSTIAVGVVTTAGTVTTNITVDATVPHLASVTFSTNLTKVYLHWRRTNGAAPVTILMDGTNVTANVTTVGDSSANFAASVLQLSTPLTLGSYHVFQGIYADGKVASASLRAWVNNFIYGIWGGKSGADGDLDAARAWVDECEDHGVNAQIMNGSSLINDLVGTTAGRQYCADHNFGFVIDSVNKWNCSNPLMWFLDDEPDNEEGNLLENSCGTGLKLPCFSNPTGVLGMHFIPLGETLRAASPTSPTTINLNGSYKPYSWQVYGQLSDVLMMDAYYDARVRDCYWDDPHLLPLYDKPTMIYPMALAATMAAEPNPFHLLIDCFQTVSGNIWPFPDPGSKRVEVYYGLAGGAKGMGYWWFNQPRGIDVWTPDAHALWKEMGLCGNEIKTVAPLLVNGHPVAMTMTGSTNVWARSLAVGTDTMILIVVNQNHYNDSAGTFHYTSASNATLTATLPTWMRWPISFEVSAGGLGAVNTQTNGNQLQFNLGTLKITRMIVLTKDPQLPVMIQQRYNQQVRPGICTMASELCSNSAPTIVLQPQSQTVLLGSNALFTVVANGTPSPTYQWRYNGANLSGATSDMYTRTNAQVSHNGSYSVVVSNSLGVVTSAVATLTVSTNGMPPGILTQPQSLSVEVGQNANFTVTANGTAPLKYQWRFGGANISGATTNSYTRSNAQLSDAGNYDVVVTNAAGSITSAVATLTVTIPCPPAGLLNASFEGSNSGGVATNWTGYQRTPNPTTVWTIQTASPPGGAGAQYQQIANTSSTGGGGVRQNITSCTVGATYSVAGWFRGNSTNSTVTVKVSPTVSTNWSTATNLYPAQTVSGSTWTTFSGTIVATSTSMTLWLDGRTGSTGQNNTACFDAVVVTCEEMPAGQPPTITLQPSAQNVCASANASFTVAATGTGTLTYQWQTNSVNISNGSHYSGCTATTLWVTNISSSDAVNYRCVVTDQNGSTTSSNAALTLKTATGFTQQPAATNICTGGTTTFSVVAVGDGTITYQWQKNSTNISNGGHYSGVTTATLTITGADASDAANYRCVVTAGCGSSTSFQGALTVRAATTITQQPSAQNVCPGTTTGFSVAATGDGTVTYQWQTNGVNISNNSHYSGCTTTTLWVTNAQSADQVNYRCVATAGCGSANSSTAALTLKAVTTITQQPVSRQASSGGKTNFTVAATGDGTVTYQWQTNGVNINNNSHYAGCTTASLWITNVTSADAVNYRCVVTAGCGSANSSTATLTVCNVASLLNPSFELSNLSGVATNWTGYQRSPNPTTVWTIQTASPPSGTGTNYQQIANTTSTGGGGVRQDIKNCVIGATYRVAGWYRGNSTLYATCTVKVSPTASTSWATAINLSPAATFTGSTWTNFSGTVVATSTNMTLWLDGQTGGTGQNKAECFDGITVTCAP